MANNYHMNLVLPRKLFNKALGFTMDFGGSAIKIIYTTEEGENVRFNFVTYSREQHKEAFSMLSEKYSDKLEPGSEVFTCGVGGSEYNQELTTLFNLKFSNVSELDRLLEGFVFMAKHLPWTDFVRPISESAMAVGYQCADSRSKMFATFADSPSSKRVPVKFPLLESVRTKADGIIGQDETENTIKFPVMIVLVGSAYGCFKVDEDGRGTYIDDMPNAGRSFLGLGSLLTDSKSFDELCALAEVGDPQKIDSYFSSFQANTEDEIYGRLANLADTKAFSFGHAVGKHKDDFKREDLSAALVSLIVDPIVKNMHAWASCHKLSQIFMIGGFPCNNLFIQEEFGKLFTQKRFYNSMNHTCDCYFLKLGAHCGSFGTILQNLGLSDATI